MLTVSDTRTALTAALATPKPTRVPLTLAEQAARELARRFGTGRVTLTVLPSGAVWAGDAMLHCAADVTCLPGVFNFIAEAGRPGEGACAHVTKTARKGHVDGRRTFSPEYRPAFPDFGALLAPLSADVPAGQWAPSVPDAEGIPTLRDTATGLHVRSAVAAAAMGADGATMHPTEAKKPVAVRDALGNVVGLLMCVRVEGVAS